MGEFIGNKKCRVNAKKSISIPTVYIEALGEDVVFVRTAIHTISIYSVDEFKIECMKKGFFEFVESEPIYTKLSESGKIVLSDSDLDFLETDNLCVIAGALNRVEIFGLENYEKLVEEYKNPENKDENLDILGGGAHAL